MKSKCKYNLLLVELMYIIGFICDNLYFITNYTFVTTYKYFYDNFYLICLATYILYVRQLLFYIYDNFYFMANCILNL